ncbi:MAG: HAMP domain-containing sensor histidine kinase, partial [Sandaracinobacteroides sp.]
VDLAAAKTAERLRIIVVSTLSVALLLALMLAWALLRSLNRPMARLTAAADALAQGDLTTRVNLAGDSEFARLGASFDRMAEELQEQRATLARSHDVLEAEVEARTAELTAANAQLSEHSETRRRLLTDVSHELRTPLTVVRGEAEVALRGREKAVEDYKSALRRIEEQAGHMSRLVDDLLFVARTASGEVRLQLRAVQVAQLVRRIVADMDLLARKVGGTVTVGSLAEGLVVQGDPDRLRQLLLILLDNAIRYSPTGCDVAIDLFSAPGGANIRVTDRGIGIPAAELPHVFERFHRASNAVELVEGVGLGLQMAKAIVEAHGGSIMIESVEGEGTTVSVQLPGGARLRSAA